MKNAYIFPGQGTHYYSMGNIMYNKYHLAKKIFNKSNKIIGYNIADIMFNSPLKDLSKTINSQIAIFLYSIISFYLYKKKYSIYPDVVAGHSLGELTSLVASNVITFEEGLFLVYNRSNIIQYIKKYNQLDTQMVSVIVSNNNDIKYINQYIKKYCYNKSIISNYNTPKQIVISGIKNTIMNICEYIKKNNFSKYIVSLNINNAYHSPLMKYENMLFIKCIENINFKKPICPVYQNIDGLYHTDPFIIKQNLKKHMVMPSLWNKIIDNMILNKFYNFYNTGPSNTISNMILKISKNVKIYNIADYLF
ncbi:MAG: ACP S-malonyltransferase [Bacteroides sp.]|nr:MAG: ACP S-malonyltransferase [Bacteroides sp.]